MFLLIITVVFIASCATAEVRAIRKGDLQQLEKFLSKGGDPNTVFSDGNPLIHIAVQYGQADSLERLLIAGADSNLLNSSGDTAAILASGQNRFDMIKILLKYRANMRIPGKGGKTTLMLASAMGNIQMMERLLSVNVPINGVDNRGSTALFYSVSANKPDVISYLLKYGADAGHIDNKGRNPLHFMTQNRNTAYARLLINAGTDPTQQEDTSGETALHVASGSGAWELVQLYLANGSQSDINLSSRNWGSPLFYSLKPEISSADAIKTLRILLNSGADSNLPSVKEIYPLTFAVEKLDVTLVEMLIKSGARLDHRFSERKTLLHIAVSRDIPELASLLIDEGINPNLTDLNGNTALFNAVQNSFMKTAELLLAKGSDPNVVNNSGATTLFITMEKDAGQRQDFSAMTNLLLRYNASLHQRKGILNSLLFMTSKSGNAEVAEYLLKSGADLNEMDQSGKTMLMSASEGTFIDLVQVLLEQGARVNMRDNQGNTAMHYASLAGSVKGVELLLHYGENPDPVNYEKQRPIQLVPENGQGLRILEILLTAGAQPLPVDTPSEVDTSPEIETTEEVSDTIVTIVDTTIDIAISNEIWGKARILIPGEKEPRGISDVRMSFSGFSSQVPQLYPANLVSKSNPKEVVIYIWNETADTAEIYKVKTDRNIEPFSIISSGEITEIITRQGNVFPIYSDNNEYFGEIKTTGQDEQYYRLIEED